MVPVLDAKLTQRAEGPWVPLKKIVVDEATSPGALIQDYNYVDSGLVASSTTTLFDRTMLSNGAMSCCKFLHTILFLAVLAAFCGQSAYAADVDFVQHVRPILQKHCYACHGEAKQKSGLRLDVKSEAFRGGDGLGPSIVAGDASESPLIQLVSSNDQDSRMPPEGVRLSAAEIEILTSWIDEGAMWPDGVDHVVVKDKHDHWSYKPFSVPAGDRSIDDFIQQRLAEAGLERNPPADARTLVRRIYFDLTGLPPTPSDVAEFVREPDIPALVDRILASPRYGERWAQHWLDVIRWAETVGFETNAERQDAWHYRDWVIAALNEDKPYDRFIYEQIAGDTVAEDAALGFLVAGPANLPGQIGRDEAAMRGARQDELDEVISTVSQAFLGLTVGCARCHDHKFDPILQSDYYAMQAIFAGLNYGTRRLRGPQDDAMTAQVPHAREEVAHLRGELESLGRQLHLREPLADVHTESFKPMLAESIRMRINATTNGGAISIYEFEAWSKAGNDSKNVALASSGAIPSASSFALANQSRHFENLIDGSVDQRQSYPWVAAESGAAWFQIDFKQPAVIDRVVIHRGSNFPADFVVEVLSPESKEWREVVHTRDRLPRVDDLRASGAIQLESVSAEAVKQIVDLLAEIRRASARLASLSAGPQVYAAQFMPDPADTFVLRRGDAMQPGDQVAPAIPKFLGDIGLAADAAEVERRMALARHLTRSDHPLTARVMVNRVWQHHFGVGLVDTPSDFGRMGTPPSHPELLDWLAAKFVADGWSLKNLHRLIVTSETYRQSSAPRAEALAIDANSRLLWRFPPRRLEAEAIRDTILSVSGNLNLKTGGPGFNFFNQRGGLSDYQPLQEFDEDGWRRMIYAHKVRMISIDVFGAFDCPDAGQMKPRRTRSVTPVQALGLFNSPFVNRQARFFAERLRAEAGSDPEDQVVRALELAYSRSPSSIELARLIRLTTDHGLEQVCRALLNTSEFADIQ